MATVALIGPDGSGKTTIARELEARQPLPLKYLYMGINAESGNVTLPTTRLLRRVRGRVRRRVESAEPWTKARPRRGSIWAAARLLHHLSEEWYRQVACWCSEASGKVVVCDRHFVFDYAPEIASSKTGFDWAVRRWMFARLYPAPDLVIFLDAPGQVLFDRKGESTAQELERRRHAYLRMGERFDRFVRVDATAPLAEVYEQVAGHIVDFRGIRRRASSVRGLGGRAARLLRRLRWVSDSVRTRFYCKAMDAALTAELPEPPGSTLRRQSIYRRMRLLVRSAHSVAPGPVGSIRRALVKSAALPFDAIPELIGFGSGGTVFRLSPRGSTEKRIVKVYRRTLGQRPDALLRLADEFRSKYETILGWYGDIVVPTHFVILASPLRGHPAVGCVQPYIADAGDDFLARPDEEVVALLRAHRGLRQQFRNFAACTLRVFDRDRLCADLLGHGNLTLTGAAGGRASGGISEPRLQLLDFGVFDLAPDSGIRADTARRLIDLIERIRRLSVAAASLQEEAVDEQRDLAVCA